MRTTICVFTAILLLFFASLPSAANRPYTLDQPSITEMLNDYWSIYGTCEGARGVSGYEDMIHASTFWYEWNTIKCSWTDYGPFRRVQRLYFDMALISGVNAKGEQPRGYLWPGFHSEKWFGLHFHYDQLPRYICAVYNDYMWSRDNGFLKKRLPQAEAVMGYMLETMDGKHGAIKCPGENNGLPDVGAPSTYMDCLREGYIVTWINAGFYAALNNMSDLEYLAGNPKQSEYYAMLAAGFPEEFDKQLWNPETNRYAGWRDTQSNLHDAGYTYANLEALARGLGTAETARCIFDWLDRSKAQPTIKGGHIGSTDIYQLVVAPRANTVRVPNQDWDQWSMPGRNTLGDSYQFAYGAALEDGGTMLWLNYYDVMARLRWLDADSAWRKFADMLFRCANDPRFLTVGHDHKYSFNPYNSYGEHYLEIGTDYPFPESGISAMSMLYGFMGVNPCRQGLRIAPNLPSGLIYAQCADIGFRDTRKTIRIQKGDLITDENPGRSVQLIAPGHQTLRMFDIEKPYNKIGVMLGTYRMSGIDVLAILSRLEHGKWVEVFDRTLHIIDDNVWTYFCVPRQQKAGAYRLQIENCSANNIAWYKNSRSDNVLRLVDESSELISTSRLDSPASQKYVSVWQPFSKVSVQLADNSNKPIRLKLYRRMGQGWHEICDQSFSSSGWAPLSISDQPKGQYSVAAFYSNGEPASAMTSIHFSRGSYKLTVLPEGNKASIKAGQCYIIRR